VLPGETSRLAGTSLVLHCGAQLGHLVNIGIARRLRSMGLLALLIGANEALLFSQSSGRTVRHHKVAELDSSAELAQAETAIEKKEYETAESLLQKFVSAEPGNYQAWYDLGFVQNAVGKKDQSIAAYRRSVAAKPDVFESNLNLGLMLAKAGQAEAERFLRAATKLKPTAQIEEGQFRAWLSLAQVLVERKPAEALDAFARAAELRPGDPEPHLSAGQLLERQKRPAEAEREYKQALALDSSSSDALSGLANVYMQAQRYADAEDVLAKLLAQHPDDAGTHIQLGRIFAAEGKIDKSISELQEGLKLAPDDQGAQRDLADIYVNAKRYVDAEALYRSMLAKTPQDPEVRLALGETLLKQRKFAEAQEELLATVKQKPELGAAYGDLAVAASENKNYDLAIKALDARAKLIPDIPVSYFLRATAYDHLRAYKQAAENYHRFLAVADGKFPDQEWQARHRLIAIEPKK
jgi:tetratricopeptide (TPR) repeat protein